MTLNPGDVLLALSESFHVWRDWAVLALVAFLIGLAYVVYDAYNL